MFRIDNIELPNPVFLAPMTGVTDLPFRQLVRKLGAGLVISEMTASDQLVSGRADMVRKIASDDADGPFVVQLVGREAHWMAEAAKMAVDAGAHMIDINMGCPARQVTKGASGSALMKDLPLAMQIIEAVIAAVPVPVTLKMRLGWDENQLNAPELAQNAQSAGVKMITVHGRNRCQFYKGIADWAAIRNVREKITIPLVANGDIHSTEDAKKALALSGADGVMIGRGCCGRPFLLGKIANELAGKSYEIPSLAQQLEYLLSQFQGSLDLYGTALGVKVFRKHLAWSIDAAFESVSNKGELIAQRKNICRLNDPVQITDALSHLFLRQAESSFA